MELKVMISQSVNGMIRQENKILNSMVIVELTFQHASLLMRQLYTVIGSQDQGSILNMHNYYTYLIQIFVVSIYQQQKTTLEGHTSNIYSVCFSSDGTLLASGTEENSIRIWDVKTAQQKAILNGHNNNVNSLCFSPDGITFAFGSSDNSIRLWNIKTGQQKAKFDCHISYVVCFSSDGTLLASGSDDIRLWDTTTGQQIQHLNRKYYYFVAQFKILQNQNYPLLQVSSYITHLIISQSPVFQAQGALIFKGEFLNHQEIDLRLLLKFKGSYILETNHKYDIDYNECQYIHIQNYFLLYFYFIFDANQMVAFKGLQKGKLDTVDLYLQITHSQTNFKILLLQNSYFSLFHKFPNKKL